MRRCDGGACAPTIAAMTRSSTRNLLPLVVAYLPVPIAGAVLSARWKVGASPEGGPRDMVLRGTALTPPLFLPVLLLGAAAVAPREGAVGRVGAGVVSLVGMAFLAGSTANLPNDFKAADAAGTPRRLTAALAAIHVVFSLALLANAAPRLFVPVIQGPPRSLTCATYNRMVVPVQTTFDPDTVFSALADATRRDIVLRALSGREGVAELATHYPMSFAAVQKHVAVLERAGLITKERTGRRKVVRTNIEGTSPGARSPRRVRSDVARPDRPHDGPHHTHGGGTTMTVTAVHKDPDTLTMILTAEFDASPERVWDLWADPRKLERWWGPPFWPATFTAHDLAPGSHVEYHMTGPTGEEAHGFWDVIEVDPPHRLVFLDGFADNDGTPNDDFPRNEGHVTIEPIDGGRTRMSIESHFPSVAAMEQVLGMGMEEGLTQAVGQIDAILAEDAIAARGDAR